MHKVNLFLDSGAYSAWYKGESLDVEDYIAYIKKYKKYIDRYVALDVIPGIPTRAPTQQEAELGAKLSYENFKKMRDAGLDPIPVFHQGEDMRWLYVYFEDEGCDYIGISCDKMLDSSTRKNRIKFLDHVFTILTYPNGEPIVKTHGFALTAIPIMQRYPWYSIDSTTWSLIGSYGFIVVPVYINGVPTYNISPVMIHISHKTERIDVSRRFGLVRSRNFAGDGKRFEALGPLMRKYVMHYIEEECGEQLADLRYDDDARRRCVIYFFQKFAEGIGEVKFQHRARGI